MKILGVLLCLSLSFAMKRTREELPVSDPDEPEAKRPQFEHLALEPLENGKCFFDSFPLELISETCAWLVDEYPARPNAKHPLGYLYCVSRAWQAGLDGGEFKARLRDNPNSALHTLTQRCFAQLPIDDTYMRELTAAYPIMNQLELFLIVLNAANVDVLRLISQTTLEIITKDQFSGALRKMSRDIDVELPCYSIEDNTQASFELKEKNFFNGCLAGNTDGDRLFGSVHNIVKLLFVDDLYRPTQFTWIFEFLTKRGCVTYHQSKTQFAELVKSMTNIALPRVRRNLLLECFTWPMTLAALIKDREFVQIFKSDLETSLADSNTAKSYLKLLKALKLFADGGDFAVESIGHLEIICHERGFLGNLDFPMDKIRSAFEPYIPRFVRTLTFLETAEDIFV